jgi:hypothetical protein
MLNLNRILKDKRLMRAMTGLTRKAFEQLLPSFDEAYQQHQRRTKSIVNEPWAEDAKRFYEPVETNSVDRKLSKKGVGSD